MGVGVGVGVSVGVSVDVGGCGCAYVCTPVDNLSSYLCRHFLQYPALSCTWLLCESLQNTQFIAEVNTVVHMSSADCGEHISADSGLRYTTSTHPHVQKLLV